MRIKLLRNEKPALTINRRYACRMECQVIASYAMQAKK